MKGSSVTHLSPSYGYDYKGLTSCLPNPKPALRGRSAHNSSLVQEDTWGIDRCDAARFLGWNMDATAYYSSRCKLLTLHCFTLVLPVNLYLFKWICLKNLWNKYRIVMWSCASSTLLTTSYSALHAKPHSPSWSRQTWMLPWFPLMIYLPKNAWLNRVHIPRASRIILWIWTWNRAGVHSARRAALLC